MKFSVPEARRMRGLTQEHMAKALGISRSKYILLEKNPEKMPIGKAKLFCSVVDIPIESIVFLPENSTLSRE